MPQIEGQTTQWPNEKADNGRQNTTKKTLMIEQNEHYWAFKLEVAFRFNSKVSGRYINLIFVVNASIIPVYCLLFL